MTKRNGYFSKRATVLSGVAAIVVFFGGFGIWAATAKISGAAVATGSLVATGQNKVVQHLEGGIVRRIIAEEGERVEAGAPLIYLDDVQAHADVRRLTVQRDVLLALTARLEAERRGHAEITFPSELAAYANRPEIAHLMTDQREEFAAGLQRHESELSILSKRMEALEEEIIGLEAQIEAGNRQVALIQQEVDSLQSLFDRGLSRQDRLLALKREEAALSGRMGQYLAGIAKARQTIAETELQIVRAGNIRAEEANEDLTRVRAELTELEVGIAAAQDVLDRSIIRAPVSGLVIKMNIFTEGGVIAPRQELLEILPEGAVLLIEAAVQPEDIDLVQPGQGASVMLSALDRRTTPMVDAEVMFVSADLIAEDDSEASYYLARLQFDDLAQYDIEPADLYPGMNVEVFLRTTDRTFAEYVARPILDSFERSFREE